MPAYQIVCESCGAHYRLPEDSPAHKAKCKHCGVVIDVDAQKAAAAEMPAAARPARAHGDHHGAHDRHHEHNHAHHAHHEHHGSHHDAHGHKRHDAFLADADKKSNTGLILLVALVGGLLLLVGGMLMVGGGNQKIAQELQTANAKAREAKLAAEKAAEAAVKANAPAPVEAPAKKRIVDDGPARIEGNAPATPAGALVKTPALNQKPLPAGVKAPLDPLDAEREKLIQKDLQAWQKLQVKSLDQVIDPRKTTAALEYPASVTAEEKQKMADLLQKAKDGAGAARTKRALAELEKMGHPALLFLVNQLREVDYKNTDDSMWGYQLNMTLQNLTMGVNTGYVPVLLDEQMDPRKAQWNAMTVQNWINGVKAQWSTKEKFDEYIKNRKAKKDAELEGGAPSRQ